MGLHWRQIMVCTVLWTTASLFMIGGTFRQSVIIMGWGGFTALVACIVSGWLVATCAATKAARDERIAIETLAQIMARCAEDESVTTRIH